MWAAKICLYQLYERENLARFAGENTNSFDFLLRISSFWLVKSFCYLDMIKGSKVIQRNLNLPNSLY